jgi:transposase InsO family protein
MQGSLSIERMCLLARVSRAGFYRFLKAHMPREEDTEVRSAIQQVALQRRRRYGYRRVTAELKRRGMQVNHKRVARIMREDNLLAVQPKEFVTTTDSDDALEVYLNPSQRMRLNSVDQLWVADITYIRVQAEFVYLAVILDGYSRKVVGWKLGRTLTSRLAADALESAIELRRPLPRVVHHSDRGVQYTSPEYVAILKLHGMVQSMSRPANPYDNASCESFIKTLKREVNVADMQDAIQTAVGGSTETELLQGEAQFDVVLRYQQQYRDTREAVENVRLLAPSGERVSLAQLTKVSTDDGAEEIYREGESRYIAIKYSVRGRDLGSTVEEAIKKVHEKVKLPQGYHTDWAGEYKSKQRADARLTIITPITIMLIFMILYTMFRSFKWATLIMLNVLLARVGGLLALYFTHTNFSVSAAIGMLALFGVSVQTGVIMLEYINQLRVHGHTIKDAAVEGAVLRLRPIMITMMVATLGLIPAALSHAIGSDSQRPFAIVIVGGLITDLLMSIFLLPTLYVWIARMDDTLPAPESEWASE